MRRKREISARVKSLSGTNWQPRARSAALGKPPIGPADRVLERTLVPIFRHATVPRTLIAEGWLRLQSETFERVRKAIATGRVHVSEHAYDEAVEDDLSVVDVIDGTPGGEVIEDSPDDPRGPSCLALLHVGGEEPIHAVWAFDDGSGRAILVTVYRPDPDRWSDDLKRRRPKP